MAARRYLIAAALAALLIVVVFALRRGAGKSAPRCEPACEHPMVCADKGGGAAACVPAPRQKHFVDCGRRPRGWYDFQGQSVKNDYCRMVGRGEKAYFSCALAGSGRAYTPPEKVYDPAAPSVASTPSDACYSRDG
jgi:hypothetical protein